MAGSSIAPHEPLGFIAWIDRQYAVLSEAKGIRFGLLPTVAKHWLEIKDLRVERVERG